MKDIVLSSGEYTYYKNFAPEVGKVINGEPTGHGNDGKKIEDYNEIVGIVMRYFEGRNLKDISNLTSMRALLEGLKRLEKEVLDLSLKGFKLRDVHEKNLMVNQKHKILSFAIMDPVPWEKVENLSFEEIYSYNINAIRTIVFKELFTMEIEKFIVNNHSLSEPYQLINTNECDELHTFMYELTVHMENKTNTRIRTLSDFKSALQRG